MTLRLKAVLKLIITMMLVSLSFVLAKKSLFNLPFFTFLWLQMACASLGILIYTFVVKKEKLKFQISKNAWYLIVGIAALNYVLVRTVFIFSLGLLSATTHAYIMNFTGLVTMIFSCILLKEIPTKIQIFGGVFALLGVWLYFHQIPSSNEFIGIFWLCFAVIGLALTNILIRQLQLTNDSQLSHNLIASLTILIGSIPLIIIGVLTDNYIPMISIEDWIVIILNGLIGVALMMVIFSQVMEYLKAYEASVIATTGLIFTAIFSMPILNDYLDIYEIAGILMMLFGIYLVQHQRQIEANI